MLLPFLVLILYYGLKAYFQFKKYRQSQMEEIQRQLQMLEEQKSLLQMKNQEGEPDENQE